MRRRRARNRLRTGDYGIAPYVLPEGMKALGIRLIFSSFFDNLGIALNRWDIREEGYTYAKELLRDFYVPEKNAVLDDANKVWKFEQDMGVLPAGDSSFKTWAVFDTAHAEVARGERPMSVSACWPGEAQAASFASDLPPGLYRVGIDVTDGRGRRGVASARRRRI